MRPLCSQTAGATPVLPSLPQGGRWGQPPGQGPRAKGNASERVAVRQELGTWHPGATTLVIDMVTVIDSWGPPGLT